MEPTTEASARMAAEEGLGQMFVADGDVDVMTDKVRRFNSILNELDLPPTSQRPCCGCIGPRRGGHTSTTNSPRFITTTSDGTIQAMKGYLATMSTPPARVRTSVLRMPVSLLDE